MYLQSYKELVVWQKAIELVQSVYTLTEHFPREETYGLAAQMRRAAISIPSNIAEGQRRKDVPEFLQFLRTADASSAELETQVIIAKRLYPQLQYEVAEKLLDEIQRMLTVMMQKLDLKAQSSKLKAHQGFTLVETLVVAGIVILIAVGGFLGLAQFRRAQAVEGALDELRAAVENVKRRSVAQEQGTRWGVRFTNATSGVSSYTLFRGAAYTTSTADRTYSFRSPVAFGNPTASSTYDALFAPLTGALSENKVITLVGGNSGIIGDLILRTIGSITARMDNSVVGYWHFDEGTSTLAYDASGMGNTGTLTNGPTWQSGASCKAGGCLDLNGSTQYVSVADSTALSVATGDFSVAAWVKLDGTTNDRVINKWLNSSTRGWILDANTGTTGTNQPGYLRFRMNDGSNNFDYAVDGNLDDAAWHHVAVMIDRDSATGLMLYVDGAQIGTSQDPTSVTGSLSADTPLGVGVIPSITGSYLDGKIDEVRVWNRVLSASEIEAHYNDLK